MKFPTIPKKTDKTAVRIPRSAQQTIPIRRIYKDGIWEVSGKYSRTWRFTDVNYSVADEEDKRDMLILYCALEKALPTDAITKISIVNKRLNPKEFQKEMLLPTKQDGRDNYRSEYNRMMLDKAAEGNNIIQERYITVSVERRSIEEARSFFVRVAGDLSNNLKKLSSRLYEMENVDRLRVLHDFFRIGEEGGFSFDFDKLARRGQDFKDRVCPDAIQFRSNYFELGDSKVGRVLFLKDYPSYLEDGFIKELTDFSRNLVLSVDIQPVPTDVALKEIQNQALAVETDITRWQNKQNQNNNFSAIPPMQLTEARNNMREFLDDLTARDQRMTLCVMTLVHIADSKKQLDADTDTIRSIAGGKNCELSVLTYQQEDGLNTALPYGLRKIDTLRTLTTESAAALVPFSSQEIRHRNGIYYGVNATSRNLIVCNRRQLLNGNGFILGVSGSGKSFAAKEEITSIALSTDDDILIVDPEREYAPLVRALGGEVVQISAGSPNHINAMDMASGYGEVDGKTENPLILKSQFIMSLCEQLMKPEVVGAKEKSIIGRCVGNVYRDYIKNYENPPTLKEFREELLRQPEPQAQSIALALELFTDGSLNVFAHQTNVNMNNRIMLFDIFDLGSQLKTVGMLVMLDAILNRVIENHKRGRRTWIYIDEIYLFFTNEYSTNFLEESWKRFRKKNAAATGITQNVTDCLRSPTAKNMLANSEFLLMLSQAPTDQQELVNLLRISEQQLGYITNAEVGHGLIKVGGALVPFINHFPANTELYKLMTTKQGEM
ncbi:TraE family protein [Oscillibacter valericigenes Sjm18-20]|nr:TraE family protein [Oscillibacter valericigenes Sjm18-20]